MPFFTKERIVAFTALFAVEGPMACAFMYYLFVNVFNEASCPASDVARIMWIIERLFLLVLTCALSLLCTGTNSSALRSFCAFRSG